MNITNIILWKETLEGKRSQEEFFVLLLEEQKVECTVAALAVLVSVWCLLSRVDSSCV